MRTAAHRDVLKVIAYIVACFLLAALITPPLYEMGQGFAHVTLTQDPGGRFTWLATKAEKAGFDTYFKRALFLSAILGLFPLYYSLRPGPDPRKLANSSWAIYRDPTSFQANFGQPLHKVRFGFLQSLTGFLLASGFFFLMALLLFQLNWFDWRKPLTQERIFTASLRALTSATLVSTVEEILFRGALLGIFLRAFRPAVAIVSISLIFAAVHHISPPEKLIIPDPRSAEAGFELLRQIGLRFLQPLVILPSFASFFIIGLLLAIARYGTASLWLPIGLHMGWVFSMKTFGHLAKRRDDIPGTHDFYVGKKMSEGLIPIGMLILTGVFLIFYLLLIKPKQPVRE